MSSSIHRLTRRLASHVPERVEDPTLVWAAVAIIVAPEPDAILFIRRADRTGDPWSGHMALPGGRRGAPDESLLDTAIRESAEEVGVTLTRAQCIGALDDVAPRIPVLPPIAVRPYVFAVEARPKIVPNVEVASAHWIPIELLLHRDTYHPVQLENAVVWGMTERIVTSLLPHIR